MAKRQTTKIGIARKRCVGKKGTALSTCMKRVMKGPKKKKVVRKRKVGRPKKKK